METKPCNFVERRRRIYSLQMQRLRMCGGRGTIWLCEWTHRGRDIVKARNGLAILILNRQKFVAA